MKLTASTIIRGNKAARIDNKHDRHSSRKEKKKKLKKIQRSVKALKTKIEKFWKQKE